MSRTSNTLSENIRSKAAEVLNRHLAAAIDLHASATFGALRQGSSENRALNRVSDPCRATILSRRAAVVWIGTLSLIGWAAILALARVIL
jgi:hypothetical protein